MKKFLLVFKTHFDIGFTKLSEEILEYYATDMADEVKATCNATRDEGNLRYVWTMPSWPLLEMKSRADDKRRTDLDDLISRGQVRWHALPFTSHYDFCGVEDAVWGLRYAKQLSQEYHLPFSRTAKMTDVPGHGRFLVEMLADAGVRFLHLGCNEFATPPTVPPLFWWEAPSGKRVLTMLGSGYGTSLLPPDDWPFDTWMALMNTNDNSGPQTADLVRELQNKIRKSYPDAEIACGTLEDFWDAIRDQDLSMIPVIKKDLADTWIHGIASYPRETAVMRRLRERLYRINRFIASENDPYKRQILSEKAARIYDAMALYAEHTWGLDVKIGLGPIPDYDRFDEYRDLPRFRRMEASWQEQSDRAAAAEKACLDLEHEMGIALDPAERTEKPETIYGEQTLENQDYRVLFSADTGVIREVYDKKHACPLLRERDGTGVFSYRHDRYGSDDLTEYLRNYAHRFSDWGVLDNGRANYPECGHVTEIPVFESCTKEKDTVRFHYMTSKNEEIVLSLTLHPGKTPLHVRLDITNKKASPYIESGSLCFPLSFIKPQYYVNKTGSVLDPAMDIADNANHAFYALERWIGAEEGNVLLGIVTHDAPLCSIGENGVHVFRKSWKENPPEFRFCLYNNMWGTNFPQWIEGGMTFEFDVLSMNHGEKDLMNEAACQLTELPDQAKLPFIPGKDLRISNIFADGETFILHVQHLSETGKVSSILGKGWTFTEENLLGEMQGNSQKDQVECFFAPYDYRVFRVSSCSGGK